MTAGLVDGVQGPGHAKTRPDIPRGGREQRVTRAGRRDEIASNPRRVQDGVNTGGSFVDPKRGRGRRSVRTAWPERKQWPPISTVQYVAPSRQ